MGNDAFTAEPTTTRSSQHGSPPTVRAVSDLAILKHVVNGRHSDYELNTHDTNGNEYLRWLRLFYRLAHQKQKILDRSRHYITITPMTSSGPSPDLNMCLLDDANFGKAWNASVKFIFAHREVSTGFQVAVEEDEPDVTT